MSEDAALLERYAQECAEDAFSELVRRHVDLVYSAALRQLGDDAHAAADVSQLVFVELARQSSRLIRHPSLSGWLYTTTRRIAFHRIRTESRRSRREEQVHSMHEFLRDAPGDAQSPNWRLLRPVLDDAMHALGETDRQAILTRFFEQQSLAVVGMRLGLNENAARMRVARALEKLRGQLAKRGISSTAAALAIYLPECAVASAPAGLAAGIISSVPAALGTTGLGTAASLFLMSSKLKTALAVGALLAAVSIAWQQRTIGRLRDENQSLRDRAEAVVVQPTADTAATNGPAPDQLEIARLRAEIVRLRQTQAKTLPAPIARATDPQPPAVNEPAVPLVDYTINAQIPFGQTLVTGGWTMAPGKRMLVWMVPTLESKGGNNPTITLQPTTVQVSDEALAALGMQDLQTDEGQAPKQLVFGSVAAKQMLENFKNQPGVEILAGGGVSSTPGIQSSVSVNPSDSGNALKYEFYSDLGADGQSVDLKFRTTLTPVQSGKKP